MKRFLSLVLLLCVTVAVVSGSCYTDNRNKGLSHMANKQYDKAIASFFAAKGCSDAPKSNDLDKLISQCVNKKKETPTPTPPKPTPPKPPVVEPTKPKESEPPRPLSVNNNLKDFTVKVSPISSTQTFRVASPAKYTVGADQPWMTVTDQASASFKVEIETNPKPRPRSGAVSVVCNDEHITIAIDQEPNIPAWTATGTTRKISSPAAEMPKLLNTMRISPRCRVGALTTNRRGVIVNGNCDVVYTDEVPESFKTILNGLQKRNARIDAITMTGSDYNCVVWDGNKWNGNVPVAMKEKLNSYVSNGAKILDVSISDDGNFVILTDRNVYASRKSDMDLIIEAEDDYGMSKNIHITPHGIIVLCEYGIVYRNIPENLASALNTLNFRPNRINFTDGGTYVITSEKGDCNYNIR